MDESFGDKYRRLQSEIQRAILQSYPNPERHGCPGDVVVHDFAICPERITAEEESDEQSAWYHITHCSPCYASFLKARNAARFE
jgi:hypothetical protein